MPIYEFYCPDCNTIYSFLSKTVNTGKRPGCPKCKRRRLKKEVSLFSQTGGATEDGGIDDLPIDESKMEQAMNLLARESEGMNEDDPRAAAKLMMKFSDITGMELNDSMKEAMSRLEAGEDPEAIESEMGDALGDDANPFVLPGARSSRHRRPPSRDETLYEM
jgi:putative FmdB family regulatory protein